jgi:glycosyltransferase involved in cell wall biosynthesis
MKIVHIIAHIDPGGGGLQAVAMRLAAAQSLLGHEVHILSYGDMDSISRMHEAARDIPRFESVNLHILPEPDHVEKLLCTSGRQLLTAVSQGAFMFHLHGIWEPVLLYAARFARRKGIRYCVCPAGMLDRWSLEQKAWKKRTALRLVYRRMLDNAHFIHVLNSDELELMAPLGLSARKEIIPNGVFVEEFFPPPEEGAFRRAINFPPDRRFILFLSRLHYKKGLDILAQAFVTVAEECPDMDMIVAGPDGGAQAGFIALVHQLGLDRRVRLVGPIYGAGKLHALADAACFCLPSRQEGFSIAIIEALACSRPVVITENCHFPEVGQAHAGLIVALNPRQVADALVAILQKPEMAAEMGHNGHRLVMENFTWPKIAAMTLKAYEDMG